MHQFTRDKFLEAVSDFHVLVYLSTCDMLPVAVSTLRDNSKRKENTSHASVQAPRVQLTQDKKHCMVCLHGTAKADNSLRELNKSTRIRSIKLPESLLRFPWKGSTVQCTKIARRTLKCGVRKRWMCWWFQNYISTLLDAVRTKDEDSAYHWFKSEEWATVEQLMQATGMRTG